MMYNDLIEFIRIIPDNFIIFLCCSTTNGNLHILHVSNFRKMYWSAYCFTYGTEFCSWVRNGWQKCHHSLKGFCLKQLKTQPTKLGIICFSPNGIFRSSFQRANIYWKWPSRFLFWITLSLGIFGRWLFALTFVTVRNSWDNYACTASTFNTFSYLKQLQSFCIICIGAFRHFEANLFHWS